MLQLIKSKPPPKVDGLVSFTADLRTQYTPEERNAILESPQGHRIAEALGRCEGVNKQMRKIRNDWMQDRENKGLRKKLAEEKIKYIECLTYIACPSRWKMYSQCWSNLNQLDINHLRRLEHFGPDLACKYERQILEQCIGSLVASSIEAADGVYDKDD